ncbi:MAG: hypothetical protein AB7M12_09340 [Hyphomonadaceae bacterium]
MSVFDFLHARAPPPPAAHADLAPTALLAFLAGEHAAAIARVWPAPHADFLALPAARRHMAAMALAYAAPEYHARIRRVMMLGQTREAVLAAAPHPPRGLARALARAGERLWAQGDYDRLEALLRDPETAEVIQHAERIAPMLLAVLEQLPAPLRRARIVAMLPHAEAAQALSEAFAAARWINPHRPERDLALAWARASDRARLFEAARAALAPDRFTALAAPAMARPYRAILSRDALAQEALRFRNCVAGYMSEAGADRFAVYVREGDPAVMVALRRDVGGWRFAEALHADNAPLDEGLLRTIAADFADAGVRIGRPIGALTDRLETLGEWAPPAPAAAESYAARLGLGQLWR